MTSEMITLTGTEKQIKWANEIRADRMEPSNLRAQFMATYKSRASYPGLADATQAEFTELFSSAKTICESIQDAAWWINYREVRPIVVIAENLRNMRQGKHADCQQNRDYIEKSGLL